VYRNCPDFGETIPGIDIEMLASASKSTIFFDPKSISQNGSYEPSDEYDFDIS
jgi:hypothetical protein